MGFIHRTLKRGRGSARLAYLRLFRRRRFSELLVLSAWRRLEACGDNEDAVLKTALCRFLQAARVIPSAEAFEGAAYCLHRLGRHEEALIASEQAQALDPAGGLAPEIRAKSLWQLGREDEAREAYRELLAAHPEHRSALFEFALTLMQAERYPEARDVFQSLANGHAPSDPVEPDPFGDSSFDEACRAFLRAYAIEPAQNDDALEQIVDFLWERERYDDVARILRRAAEGAPAARDLWARAAYAYATAGRPADARDLCEKATEDRPDSFDPWYYVGLARYGCDDFPGSVEAFKQALAHNPTDVDALVFMGHAHRAAGKADEAREAYRRALQLEPDENVRREALESLALLDEGSRGAVKDGPAG